MAARSASPPSASVAGAGLMPCLLSLIACDLLLIAPPLFTPPTGSLWGVLIVCMGMAITVWARRHLGRSWSGGLTIQTDHKLVRTGPYAWTRHPIYIGLILAYTGTALFVGGIALLAPFFAMVAFIYKIRIEERQLIEVFPEYREYQRSTSALLPINKKAMSIASNQENE